MAGEGTDSGEEDVVGLVLVTLPVKIQSLTPHVRIVTPTVPKEVPDTLKGVGPRVDTVDPQEESVTTQDPVTLRNPLLPRFRPKETPSNGVLTGPIVVPRIPPFKPFSVR